MNKKSIVILFILLFFTVIIFNIKHVKGQTVTSKPTITNKSTINQNDPLSILIELLKMLFGGSGSNSSFYETGSTPSASNPYQPLQPQSAGGLDYAVPLRDIKVVPVGDAKDRVRRIFPSAKIEYWDIIVAQSIANNWNPAFVLALWIEETGASMYTCTGNGGAGILTSAGHCSKGHLGCAPWEEQTIDESLRCLFKNFSSFTNGDFGSFMARYSGGSKEDPFDNNPYFPGNIKRFYLMIVPAGNYGELQEVNINSYLTSSPQPQPATVITQCSPGGEKYYAPQVQIIPALKRGKCIKPTMIVLHWSGAWLPAEETIKYLNRPEVNLSCQFAVDQNKKIQALDFYKDENEKGECAGGVYNDVSINLEITGSYFDLIITNPNNPYYNQLMWETKNTLDIVCWAMKQYNITPAQIYGHFQLYPGKVDPGQQYLNYFINRAKAECL